MRLYTIPTNRICLENAVSYLKEISYVSKKYKEDFLYLVLASGKGGVQEENEKLFEQWNLSYPEQRIYYESMKRQEDWIESLLKSYPPKERENLKSILLADKDAICYGSILNRSFLIAASLDMKSLHRRDSDTMLNESETEIYPLEYEIEELGKVYSNKIRLAGSSYLGEWAADFGAIYKKDPHLLYRHVALNYPNRPMSQIIDLVEKRYAKSEKCSQKKLVQDRLAELGNCSFQDIYYKFPVCPAKEMMATDYFLHDIEFACGNDILYHPSKVDHHHTKERQSKEWFLSYNFRCARYKTYNLIMYRVFEKIRSRNQKEGNMSDILNAKLLAELIWQVRQDMDLKKEGEALLGELANIFRESQIQDYVEVADEIGKNKEALLMDVQKAIEEFICLLENWEELIEKAGENPYELSKK